MEPNNTVARSFRATHFNYRPMTTETKTAGRITEMTKALVLGLCERHEDVHVKSVCTRSSTMIQVQVRAEDYGKVCGTAGVTIQALTRLIERAGRRRGETVRVRLVNSVVGDRYHKEPFVADERWSRREEFLTVLDDTLDATIGQHGTEVTDMEDGVTIVGIVAIERVEDPDVLKEDLVTVFEAIGRAMARVVTVDVTENRNVR